LEFHHQLSLCVLKQLMRIATHSQTLAYITVSAVFLAIVAPDLFSEGMFMDGLYYAAVAHNMARGIGSFWSPHFTSDLYPVFYEHPPLAMGMQAVLFQLFGSSIYVERWYSLLMYAATGVGISLLWKALTGSFKYGWLPLLLWLVVGEVIWSVSNNMLENTMTVFTTLAAWAYFESRRRSALPWLVLSGLLLSLALLTKGPFCLYLWGLPAFDWYIRRQDHLAKATLHTAVLVAATALPIAALYLWHPEARVHMEGYVAQQVMRSVDSVQTVDYRAKIVVNFLKGILPQVAIAGLLLAVMRKRVSSSILYERLPLLLLLLAVALGGVLPIMISMKQRAFYILTVYPLVAVGLAYVVLPHAEALWRTCKFGESRHNRLKLLAFSAVACGVCMVLSLAQIGRVGRNKEMVHDVKLVLGHTGMHQRLRICTELYHEYGLHGYMARYGHAGLSDRENPAQMYYLTGPGCPAHVPGEGWQRVPIDTKQYHLYERRP
jgi:4-amino-4-deoxy-L-arabinose transferase-like glycosyltransferase